MPVRESLQVRGALARGAFAVTVLVSLVVLFAPGSDVPTAPPGVDKAVHAVLFAALAVSGRWAGLPRTALIWLLLGYGAVSEVVQGLAPLARSGSPADWLADAAGVLIGTVVWELAARRRQTIP